MTTAAIYRTNPAHRISRSGLVGVAAAHLIVVFALLQMQVISLPTPLAVLSVSLLPHAPEPPAPRKPEIVPPKPKPVVRQPLPQPRPLPQLAAPIESPAITPAAVPPAPTFTAPPSIAVAAPAPAPVATQPRFDANYLDNPKPAYPAISRRMGEEGRVMLRVRVNAEGVATDVQLHASSGFERLDTAALTTVQRWKFVPARLGTEAVAASVLVPIVFSLRN